MCETCDLFHQMYVQINASGNTALNLEANDMITSCVRAHPRINKENLAYHIVIGSTPWIPNLPHFRIKCIERAIKNFAKKKI